MQEIAEVYSRSLFEVAVERGVIDQVKEQLGQFADALRENRQLSVFFFSPYFSSEEKKDGLERALSGAEPIFSNFLQALIERHRMPVIFRIRARYDKLWEQANKLLPVSVTTAVPLDRQIVEQIGQRIGEQTGKRIELSAGVDSEILGGLILRVGNLILDASIRNRLDQLRKQVA